MADIQDGTLTGTRMSWWAAPAMVRREVEVFLGGRVVEAVSRPGGSAPGVAARLRTAGGRRAFVKAAGRDLDPAGPRLHRTEARIAGRLPATAPVPVFLGSIDLGGWVTLLFEDVDGRPPHQPWAPAELDRVLAALTVLAAELTPAPAAVPTAAERLGEEFQGWRRLAEGDRADLDPWLAAHLDDLAEREPSWAEAAAGDTLAHADVRADNLLLTGDRVVFADWPRACRTVPWFDLLAMLPGVRLQGGPPPAELFAAHPLSAGADEEAVTAVLSALAGHLIWSSRLPPPPGAPTVRAFQAAQGEIALAWLRDRTDP
ncbi:aminoglycoside phosphotransferase family protein [Actinomadura parmotrematis]|uniref:Aminoglycoside phosphotransferase family protein n=1 Tax=Actinomadura parmotrematis TaxID=2864039 RepID=A0ABS7G484_9ACTN|nr:aminoglycoside phosphotransferase family protein [Actinomadura parmotrematis]MBW8487536.1 aminoglycoside phosphotransferase family protein [Actinomadura parmotrematis]